MLVPDPLRVSTDEAYGARVFLWALVDGFLECHWRGDLVTHPDEHKGRDLPLPERSLTNKHPSASRLNPISITVSFPILKDAVSARLFFENLHGKSPRASSGSAN